MAGAPIDTLPKNYLLSGLQLYCCSIESNAEALAVAAANM